jgi:RimJ/RimL family protein N-acetyltransferase
MYGLVPANNEKALRLNKKMGFTEAIRLKEAYTAGVDYVLMELRKENCKYLG